MDRPMRWISGVALLGPALAATAQPGILAGPFAYNGHQYYVLQTSSWTAAETAAVALGGHLVTINDAAEQAWVHANLHVVPNNDLWIGLNDAAFEGQWEWTSGEPVTYTNWNPGEPNGGTAENYVHLYRDTGLWNDIWASGNWPTNGVVEIATTCYPNCDHSTATPILNINDFICFLNRFATQDPYANCDHSTTAPVLNVLDFTCFLNSFAAGCS